VFQRDGLHVGGGVEIDRDVLGDRAGVFLDEPEDVAIYLDTTAHLRAVALEHEPSVRFVAAVADEYRRG